MLLKRLGGVTLPIRTALFEQHLESGANIVDFHGFELPIWYSSIKDEHLATRSSVGMFDVSHMGCFRFSGDDVRVELEAIATQGVTSISPGRCAYTHFLDNEGFIIDDMIFAVVSESEILGVPNASMVEVMWDWFSEVLPKSVNIENLSDSTSIIAIQGPDSPSKLLEVLGESNVCGRFRWQEIENNPLEISGWIQGTGYTGERGFEIFIPNNHAPTLWKALLAAGVTPVGLGARDTLRLEKGYLLSGQDFQNPSLGDNTFLHRNTWETNVPFGLDLNHEFIGKSSIELSSDGNQRWWGIKYLERGPMPRPGKEVADKEGNVIGKITSGAPSPSLNNTGIGMAYISGVNAGDVVYVLASPRKSVKAVVSLPPFI